jgi:hypothetical protein
MSSPLDGDYSDSETSSAWASDGTPADTSFSDTDAQGASDLATLPDYSMGTNLPGAAQASLPDSKLTSLAPGPNLTDDHVSTQADSQAAEMSLHQTAAGALPALQQAVSSTPDRISQAAAAPASGPAGPPANPLGPTVNPWQPRQPLEGQDAPQQVNAWTDISGGGYLAAQLVHADYSLLAAVAAAGGAAGGQAALVASTVTIDPAANTVTAGGSQPVGSRGTPAGALAGPSEHNAPKQFHVGPWFFPAVASWAAANPPPAQAPGSGAEQAEQPAGSAQGQIEPGSQFAAEGVNSPPGDDLAGGIGRDVDSIAANTADLLM